jgi:hypothetical protein
VTGPICGASGPDCRAVATCTDCRRPLCAAHDTWSEHAHWDEPPRAECAACAGRAVRGERAFALALAVLLVSLALLALPYVSVQMPACTSPPTELTAPQPGRKLRNERCVAERRAAQHAPTRQQPNQAAPSALGAAQPQAPAQP